MSDAVLITGAARGIGRAMALEFARKGRQLVLAARSTQAMPNKAMPGTLEAVADEVRQIGAPVEIVRTDLSKTEDVDALIAVMNERYGGCDVLVNNAALSFVGPFLEIPARRWVPVMAVNLLAPVALAHALLPGMLERGRGVVMNISSGASQTTPGEVQQLAYGASKAGMERWTAGLEEQLGGKGVSFHCIRIDELVVTEAVALAKPDLPPDHRRISPEELAEAAVGLADRPELSGQILRHADLREVGLLRP